ncbi:CGNR zinc finger domain-containing protein [Allorhizocola rhizosphaerae]|uniref:CGNR zinc finger domain-containing protein n=1 Tax=Allorhizocola rhizosphaerae TaxID=1872709 RepID=UPI000E3E22AA|nr:CGNR zinc finger domain-containing protein [Allorhizocola rhizosphaerae]
MDYVDYLGNVTRFAVELVNSGGADDLSQDGREMLEQHHVARPAAGALAPLLRLIDHALAQVVDAQPPTAVDELLKRYPPRMHLSTHDGAGIPHIHFAHDGSEPVGWIGRTVAATLAHVATGDPGLTLGRCAASGCARYFVDQSRNRTRRFCSNTCASRTTVAAYRARAKEG